jgi:hypothetical protein
MEQETIDKIADPTLASDRGVRLTPPDYKGKLHLRKMRINNEGFDSNGKFFGIETSVYSCTSKDGTVDFTLQAKSREDARKEVLETYPEAVVCHSRGHGESVKEEPKKVSWFKRFMARFTS